MEKVMHFWTRKHVIVECSSMVMRFLLLFEPLLCWECPVQLCCWSSHCSVKCNGEHRVLRWSTVQHGALSLCSALLRAASDHHGISFGGIKCVGACCVVPIAHALMMSYLWMYGNVFMAIYPTNGSTEPFPNVGHGLCWSFIRVQLCCDIFTFIQEM